MWNKYRNIKNIVFVLVTFSLLQISFLLLTFITQNLNNNTSFPFLESSWTYLPSIFLLLLFPFANLNKFSWDKYELLPVLKPLILIFTGILFWEHFFSDYDYYLNTNLPIEKLILAISFLLILYNPLFTLIFLIQSYLIWQSHQFALGSIHFTDMRPVYQLITLFISFSFIKRLQHIHTNVFLLLAFSLHASNYFIPGITKIELSPNGWEWVSFNQLSNLFVSSYLNGWLGFLDQNIVLKISNLIAKAEFIISPISLLIELSGIMLLFHRRLSIFILIGFQLLHLGIFFTSGIFFWSWMILNFGLIFLLKNLPVDSLNYLYQKKNRILFIVLVLISPILFQPSALGWWDGNLNTTYDFILTTKNQDKIKFNRNDFGPYDMIFSQNRFYYTSDEKILNNTYGVILKDQKKYSKSLSFIFNNFIKPLLGINPKYFQNNSFKIYQQLENAENLNKIKQIVETNGKNQYNLDKKLQLENFLRQYFFNLNQTTIKNSWYNKLGAPYHIYDLSEKRFDGKEVIIRVEVFQSKFWYDKHENEIVNFEKRKIIDFYVEEN